MAGLAIALHGCKATGQDSTAHGAIGGDVVARVGGIALPASLVRAVAIERGLEPKAALTLLIEDAVAARGAEVRGLASTSSARFATLSVLARATIDHLLAEARRFPPTDEEVRAASAGHWLEVDAPETFLVVHAVARRPKEPNAAAEAAAKDVAAAVLAAVAGAVDADDFQARASAVPAGHTEVVVETLEPFTADGRIAAAGAPRGYDPAFAAGAAGLQKPGDTSGVVESSFGWHVIRLIARRPAVLVPFEERRRRFAGEVENRRTRDALEKLEARIRAKESVVIANGIDDLLLAAVPAAGATADSSDP